MAAARSGITLAPAVTGLSLTWPEPARVSPLALAYSGGLDSTVLLHLLAQAAGGRLRALHVHHGLQAAADDWAGHCTRAAAALGVSMQVVRVQVTADGTGLEAAARRARYRALSDLLRPGEVLVTAHHRQDQAETLLLNLLRGSGVDGLAGMAAWSVFEPGFLWRPLLDTPRAVLAAWADQHKLHWIEDPHNRDPRFSRSRLRQQVLPVIRAGWPAAEASLARTAGLMRDSAGLLREIGTDDVARCRRDADSLDMAALGALSAARRRNALRAWLVQRLLPLPNEDLLRRVDREVFAARASAGPVLRWPGAELRRYREQLFAMAPLPAVPAAFDLAWPVGDTVDLPPGCGRLQGRGPCTTLRRVRIRSLRPGERFRTPGCAHLRTLKNLFQERGVPPWVRRRAPVVELDRQPLWIGGIGPGCLADGSAPGLEFDWIGAPAGAAANLTLVR